MDVTNAASPRAGGAALPSYLAMGMKKLCDEYSDAAQKHDDASHSQFGAVHCGRMP